MVDITWKKYEKDMSSDNPEIAHKATDAFIEEREKQTSTSVSARNWERDRKERAVKEKPLWKKEQLKKNKIDEFGKSLRSWSGYDEMIQPCANYLLVETEEQENTTGSGIILKTEAIRNNQGICIAIGGEYVSPLTPNKIQPPCEVGDKILFKIGAGIEVEIKEKKYKFMQYSDVLGIFKNA